MNIYTRLSMQDMLAQSLYLLMNESTFDKITIKQITSKTGVIRGTFYNHFYDKYEALEYLVNYVLVQQHDENDYSILFKKVLKTIEEEKTFFEKCFKIEGQNNFEDILSQIFTNLLRDKILSDQINTENIDIDIDLLVNLNGHIFVYIIKDWVLHNSQKSSEQIYQIFEVVFSKSIKDILY